MSDHNETVAHHPPLPPSVVISAIAVCALLMLIGITGNLLTIIALSTCRKLHNATTALVINLAAADLFFCAFVMPVRAAMFDNQIEHVDCGLFLLFFYGNVTASLVTMMAIAVNRYLLVLHSDIYYRIFSFRGTTQIIVFVWIYSYVVWMVPITKSWGHFEHHKNNPFCKLKEEKNSPKYFLAFFGFVFPLVVISIAYIAVFIKVWLNQRHISALSLNNGSRHQLRHVQFTRVLLVAYCSFLIFWGPNFVILMIPDVRDSPLALTAGEALFWISSCTNPVVYVVCSKYYRQAYYSLFKPSLRRTMDVMDCSRRPGSLPKIVMHDAHSGVNPSQS